MKKYDVEIKEMTEHAGKSHLLTILSYPNTGHLIEPPHMTHTRSSLFKSSSAMEKKTVLWGGEVGSHSRAQQDAWRKILAFLTKNLCGGGKPVATLSSHL